jgi:hypothetical protein
MSLPKVSIDAYLVLPQALKSIWHAIRPDTKKNIIEGAVFAHGPGIQNAFEALGMSDAGTSGWNVYHASIALDEGWGIFDCGGYHELQRDDEGKFVDDEEAWCFVRNRYYDGDPTAIAALFWLADNSPEELIRIWKSWGRDMPWELAERVSAAKALP